MATVDLVKELSALYKGTREWVEVVVPPRRMLQLDGRGDPNAPEFAEAVAALYSVAYSVKFSRKKAGLDDFKVPPLEALWDIRRANTIRDADWVALLPIPDFVTIDEVEEARSAVAKKKPNPRVADVRLDTYDEGLCLQYLHVGPYADEAPVIADLHANLIPGRGLSEAEGWHHEVYLSDPNRSAPEKLKTLLRQPVVRVSKRAE